jgi:hypothetical protein
LAERGERAIPKYIGSLNELILFASSRADRNVVFDPGDARSGPGGVHRFVVFSARAGGAAQAYDSMGHMRPDMTAIDEGVAPQGCFDERFDVSRSLA